MEMESEVGREVTLEGFGEKQEREVSKDGGSTWKK